jgi:hypothetical protein
MLALLALTGVALPGCEHQSPLGSSYQRTRGDDHWILEQTFCGYDDLPTPFQPQMSLPSLLPPQESQPTRELQVAG